jgi:hypothetical protein
MGRFACGGWKTLSFEGGGFAAGVASSSRGLAGKNMVKIKMGRCYERF